jgi:hypothetical protein
MINDSYESNYSTNGKSLVIANINKQKTQRKRVLSAKVSAEDYGAYKIAADYLFEGSISQMLKTALRRYLRGQAVNDEKFEILKDAAKTGDHSRVDDSFFVLKPRIVKFRKPREYGIIFE